MLASTSSRALLFIQCPRPRSNFEFAYSFCSNRIESFYALECGFFVHFEPGMEPVIEEFSDGLTREHEPALSSMSRAASPSNFSRKAPPAQAPRWWPRC